MPTLTSLANGAARDLGIMDSGGSLSAAQLADALVAINQILDSWSQDGRRVLSEVVDSVAVTNPTASYALATRRAAIKSATAIPSSGPATPLKVVDAAEWGSIPDRGVAGSTKRLLAQALAGMVDPIEFSQFTDPDVASTIQTLCAEKNRPDLIQVAIMIATLSTGNTFQSRYLFYDRGHPTGTIYLAGPPQTGTVQLVAWAALTAFPDVTTNVALLPGYELPLRLTLAKKLAPEYDMAFSKEAEANLAEAMATIETLNTIQAIGDATGSPPAGDSKAVAAP